ncbi:MAG TPA: glycosyltransferase family 2 protein [Polyangiaceae bacterium]|jgi:cellulose synthase/poly-beta-1,6-N-acetylglucosamine synthase-like glycosyltransferase
MSVVPFVSVAMPSYNEEPYIEECLRSLLGQDYPADRMEILVADGGSKDRTREIVGRLASEDRRIRLLDNSEHRIQSYGMNLAIKESKGEFILITDVHAEYAQNYVSKLIDAFQRTNADCAGGAQRAKAETWFQKALCAALSSPLGVGGAPYRSAENEGFVDTVFPGSFRRSILEKIGLYDVKAVTNEDAELQQRVLQAGGKVFLSKDVVVHYYPRKSFRLLAKQYFKYGDGRARTLLLHGRFPVMRPLIPFLSVVGGATILVVPPLQPFAPLAFGAYAAMTGLEAVRVGSKVGLWAIPVVWAIFPTMHLSHGIGMLQGLVKYTLKPKAPLIETLEPLTTNGASHEPAVA